MSTVGATALLRCLVDLDMFDDQVAGVEALGVGVRFGVLEETEEELGGLFGPAGFGDAELFAYAMKSRSASRYIVLYVEQQSRAIRKSKTPSLSVSSPNVHSAARFPFQPASHLDGIISRTLRSPPCTPSIPPHGHRLLMIDHIAQVGQRALKLPAIDGLGCFAGVFEGDAEIGTVSAGGFALFDRGGCVADLEKQEWVSLRRVKDGR